MPLWHLRCMNGKQKFLTLWISLNWAFFSARKRKLIMALRVQQSSCCSHLWLLSEDISRGKDYSCIFWLRKGWGVYPSAHSLDGVGEADPARAPPASLHENILLKKKKKHHHNRFAQVSKKHKTKHKWCVNTVIKNGALKPPVLVQWHQQNTEEDW